MSDFAERLSQLPDDTLAALSFFSRVPVSARPGKFGLHTSSGAWPIAGLLLALAPAASVIINHWLGIPWLVSAFLALAAGMVMTGALHEDGLADTFDGLGGRGGRERRLAIMRDSRLGTYGALALFIATFVKGFALASLLYRPWLAALALLLCAVVSRAAALWHWSATAAARQDGMAFSAGRPDTLALQIGLLSGLVATVLLGVAFGWSAVLGVTLAVVATGLFSRLTQRRFGGHTGDTIGAAQQIAETFLFVGLSAASTINFS